MRKGVLISCLLLMVVFVISFSAPAQEKLLIADYLEEALTPLLDFFQNLGYSAVSLSSPLPPIEDLKNDQYRKELALQGNLLLILYERDSLLFAELIDLSLQKEIMALVRKKEDREELVQGIKTKLTQIWNIKPETRIIFPREERGQCFLVTSDLSGKKQNILHVTELGSIEDLSVSPDAQHIGFIMNHGYRKALYLLHLKNRQLSLLTPWEWNDSSFSFAEKERKILFVSEGETEKGIFTMNMDGSSRTILLSKDNPVDSPSLSSDGRQLIYCELVNGQWQLKIKDMWSEKEWVVDFPGHIFQPVFSHDEKNILFIGETNGIQDLYSYQIAEQNFTRLTIDNFPKAHPSPSSDGRWIVFRAQKEHKNWDIFLFDRSRKLTHRLTSSLAQEGNPVFFPYPTH